MEAGLQGHPGQAGSAYLLCPCPGTKQGGLQGAEMQRSCGPPRLKGVLEEKTCILGGNNPRHTAGAGLLGITATLMAHEAA